MAMQQQSQPSDPTKVKPGDALRALLRGDYTHGHPGLPPKDYKAPRESRR